MKEKNGKSASIRKEAITLETWNEIDNVNERGRENSSILIIFKRLEKARKLI